jgi:cytochrome c oxidase assembly factor 3
MHLTTAANAHFSPAEHRDSLDTRPPWDSKFACWMHAPAAPLADTTANSKPFRSTYYDDRMRASPALLRARAPYLIKNTITGFAICSLVIGICTHPFCLCLRLCRCPTDSLVPDTYTINAISQDEFEDVIVPDKPLDRSAQPTTQALQQAMNARK